MSHAVITEAAWMFQIWNNDMINLKTTNLIKEIDDLNRELKISPKSIKNLITQQGLEEIAKRGVPSTTKTTNSHHAIGTGTNQPTQGDTALETEVLRKQITTSSAFANTERYATAFVHTGTDYDITEAGIYTAQTGGIMMTHVVTRSPAELRSGHTLTIATTITHKYKAPTRNTVG